MSYTAVDFIKHPSRGYEALVAVPLALVTIFCFGLAVMHPYDNPQPPTASLSAATSETQKSSLTSPAIINLTSPPALLSKLSNSTSSASTSTSSSSSTSSALSVGPNHSSIQGVSSKSSDSQAASSTASQQSPSSSSDSLQGTINNTAQTVGQDLDNLSGL